jgi:hypothetical protein
MTLRSGRSHTWQNIPIWVPSQASEWIRTILFHSCGGIRPVVTLFVTGEVQWMG